MKLSLPGNLLNKCCRELNTFENIFSLIYITYLSAFFQTALVFDILPIVLGIGVAQAWMGVKPIHSSGAYIRCHTCTHILISKQYIQEYLIDSC